MKRVPGTADAPLSAACFPGVSSCSEAGPAAGRVLLLIPAALGVALAAWMSCRMSADQQLIETLFIKLPS